jgi:hypothetical protein
MRDLDHLHPMFWKQHPPQLLINMPKVLCFARSGMWIKAILACIVVFDALVENLVTTVM